MLVTFSCPAHADIKMFGDIAIRLIKMMGHSGTVPSAILADGVPAALQHLRAALEPEKQTLAHEKLTHGDDEEPAVSLWHRAIPLLELLEAAKVANCNVMWDRD